jgi:hypothetical protein
VTPAAPAATARVLGHPKAAVSQVALPSAVASGRLSRLATAACDGDDGSCQHDADLEGEVAVGGGGGSWKRVAAHDDGFDGNLRREGSFVSEEYDHLPQFVGRTRRRTYGRNTVLELGPQPVSRHSYRFSGSPRTGTRGESFPTTRYVP